MKPKTMILMVVAVVCGLVASYLTSRMLAQNKDTGSEEEKVKVLVAKQKIPMGTKIKEPEKLFVEKEFTKGTEPKHAITSYDQLKDKSLNKTIGAEVHVTADDLLKKEEIGLQEDIAPGMRAVAIQVKSDTNVGGFILPHSRVDVVSTSRENGLLSQIILQDVLVLAVDQMKVRDSDKTAVPSSTVTLQVKPEDAERLALAGNLGELRLILRGADDHDAVHTHGVKPTDVVHSSSTNSSVGGQDDAPAGGAGVTAGGKIPDLPAVPATGPGARPEPEPALQTHTLTIYNGEVPTKAVFVLGDKNNEASTRIERTPLEPTREEKKAADPAAPKSDKDTTESTPKKDLKESESTTSRRPGK